jgi:hypothetical protein
MTLGCLLGGLRSSEVFLIEGDQLGERLTNWFRLVVAIVVRPAPRLAKPIEVLYNHAQNRREASV